MFTPGPWVKRYCDRVTLPEDKDGTLSIAHIYSGVHWKETEANANLIAAAPDMYETLKEMFSKGAFHPGYVKRIENALAKAEGRNNG